MNVIQKHNLQLLDIQEVTTKKQKANGTREFKLPVKDQYGAAIHVASFASGYIRRTRAGGHCPSWQLNKTYKEKEYININDYETGRPVIRTFNTIKRKLILDEVERLDYLISFCLKNYYIRQSNMLSNGNFIPKWKHEYKIKDLNERLNPAHEDLSDALENKVTQEEHNEAYNNGYEAGSNNAMAENCTQEVKVIVNGHRYNVI